MLKIRGWLRNSERLHAREQPVGSLTDLVSLVDRFLDGTLRYPLEWDDFVSWTCADPGIEAFRERIADLEPLFFSSVDADRRMGVARLLEERNRAVALIGRPHRRE
jgi:hypothetical protein